MAVPAAEAPMPRVVLARRLDQASVGRPIGLDAEEARRAPLAVDRAVLAQELVGPRRASQVVHLGRRAAVLRLALRLVRRAGVLLLHFRRDGVVRELGSLALRLVHRERSERSADGRTDFDDDEVHIHSTQSFTNDSQPGAGAATFTILN